jgi:kynurenine formamidase
MCLSGTAEAIGNGHDTGHSGHDLQHDDSHPPHESRAGRVTRRGALLGAATAAMTVAAPVPALASRGRDRGHARVRDLTHVFRAGFPVYTGDPPARQTIATIPANGFYAQAWTFAEHSGTHMDAPGHFDPGGRLTPQLDPEELFAPIVVIDISERAARAPDAMVEVRDLVGYERRHGRIPRRAAVFMYSGWERRVGDPDAYRNPGPDGRFHFPGFGVEAVEWLLERRRITCIGVDTLSLDIGSSTTFDVHKLLLGADRYGLENLANLRRIPAKGAEAIVGVVPWEAGSGGPCRVLARW